MDICPLATLYEQALSEEDPGVIRESAESFLSKTGLPDERTLQLYLLEGRFGDIFTDDQGRNIHILDYGEWNKTAGPDFLHAHLQINGESLTGDIELDTFPEDWERHGHGSNPAFNNVALHLVCKTGRQTWFTRNARHERIAMAAIPDELLSPALSCAPGHEAAQPCRHAKRLAAMSAERLEQLLLSAAAYRFQGKHRRHAERLKYTCPEQVLYEHLAETLGYHANKNAMLHLALRAPLQSLRACPEALLFGAAGFLVPVLPASCTPEAIRHHKTLWEQWWPLREQFELSPERTFPWALSGSRPANHPQRRVGALSVIAADFTTFHQLCTPHQLKELTAYLSALRHPYWSHHVTLPSSPVKTPMTLMGKDRIREFIVNHILPADGTEKAWNIFLSLKPGTAGSKIAAIHQRLLGMREDAPLFMNRAWHHQALLQIHEDLCFRRGCTACNLV